MERADGCPFENEMEVSVEKRFIVFCMAFFLVLMVPLQVQAAGNSEKTNLGVSAYCIDDQLCAFVNLGDAYDGASIKATAFSDNTVVGGETAPVPLKESNAIVRYLFMVDLSGSMKEHIGEINLFVKSLMNAEKQNAVYTVASFGERFTVVAENQTDKDAVINILSELKYDEKLTNPYSGIENALNYLDTCLRKKGDIVNLIMISDGEPDLGFTDKAKEEAAEKKGAKKAAEKIASAPETVVHTMIFSKKDSHAFDSFKKNSGISQTVKDSSSGEKAGKKIASFVDKLYSVTFSLQGEIPKEQMPLELQFRGSLAGGQLVMLNVPWDSVPQLNGFSSGEKDIKDQKDSKSQKDKEADGDDGKDKVDLSGQEDLDKEVSDKKVSGFAKYRIYLIVGCSCIVVAALLILLLNRRKKSHTDQSRGAIEDAVYMKLEIISGHCKTSERELYLSEQLIVGSGSDCDLVWKEEGVSKHNSRIYRRDQMIYIEDLDSKNGTFLNGMRLHAPNRLRSGDEIMIDTACFLLRF